MHRKAKLTEAAKRELSEETGVDAASLLTQFGAYGDPERDPRMNVVTVAYLAVRRDVGAVVGGHGCGGSCPGPGVRRAQGNDRPGVRSSADRARCD
jgi:ADP-ribose pyrophosphatase YjhB (NUDIX family)